MTIAPQSRRVYNAHLREWLPPMDGVPVEPRRALLAAFRRFKVTKCEADWRAFVQMKKEIEGERR